MGVNCKLYSSKPFSTYVCPVDTNVDVGLPKVQHMLLFNVHEYTQVEYVAVWTARLPGESQWHFCVDMNQQVD